MRGFFSKFIIAIIAVFIFAAVSCLIYKFVIPPVVTNKYVINVVEKQVASQLGANLKIQGIKLKTGVEIAFKVDKLTIDKDGQNILSLTDIDTLISFKDILSRRVIIVKKMLASGIYADIDELTKIIPAKKKKKKKKESIIKPDLYNVLLGVKNCKINYNNPDFNLDFTAKHMIFDRTQKRKYLHFDFDFDLEKQGHKISVSANDKNKIYMEEGVAYVDNFPIEIEKSKIIINAFMTRKMNYELKISADNFSASDIAEIVRSNIVVANGSEILSTIGNVTGNVDFCVKYNDKNNLTGDIKINEIRFEVIPLLNLPVKVISGQVDIGNNNINLKGFEGYYNNVEENKFKLDGDVKDYTKTCNTEIRAGVFVTNDFFKNYLSVMLGSPIELVGKAGSFLKIKSINGSCDIVWYFVLKEGMGFRLGEQSMVLKDYKTMFKVDLSVIKNLLKINTINYYITNELKRGISPVLTMNGEVDIAENKFLELNLDIPRPLPSEFLNFLSGQKIFKKGEVSGTMKIDNHGKVPFMQGEFALDKVLVPAQRMYIKTAKLAADGNIINVSSQGRFRRSSYKYNGRILNELRLPIIFKDMNLSVDGVDVEKILEQPSVEDNSEPAQTALISTGAEGEEDSLEIPPFPKGLLVIEKCCLDLVKGVYKDINFGNIHADMTLDKEGVLDLKSNRFDIADGISTLKIKADLVKRNYYMRLGVKDVDSNIMATSILGLPRQISGKAMGLIELNADKTLNLNGDIKFKIKDGAIEQVGYVEYILKVASVFRNPLAMISPSLVVDIVNIPEGRFDEIHGEMKLKDNVVQRMKIESTAPELAALIFGRYDLTTNDASLRIYTKFSDKGKGFAGMLRNISLNTLATKMSISSRNESNYYANELSQIPKLETGEESAQVFLTKVDGDIINFNFLSSLKRIK